MNAHKTRITLRYMLLREMWHSRWNTAACLLVVASATALYVVMLDIGAASVDATRVLMKEMGFNLVITPADADPVRFQALDFEGPDMPESYVDHLANERLMLAQHFVGKLQHTTRVEGYTVVLTGVLGQTTRTGTAKDPMPTSYTVPQGEVYLGAAAARAIGKNVGERLTVLGRDFGIGRILSEYGTIPEDIRVFMHLHDVQELLGRPGRINAIDALACQCPADAKDIVQLVRENIEGALPDVQVQPYYSLLLARHEQRALMRRIELAVLTASLIAAAMAVWGLTYQNVSARRHEVGVLHALGVTQQQLLILFLGKAALYAFIAALLGCALGRAFSFYVQPNINTDVLVSVADLLWLAPIAAVATMVFCLPPLLGILLREPADILGETLP